MNLDITPENASTPVVRLYDDSMDPISRGQTHNVETHATLEGNPLADPGDEGLAPGEVVFDGRWFGADASTLADRLRTILDDVGITTVDVNGVSGTSEYDGSYRIAEESRVDRVVPQSDAAYRYRIKLIELNT
jgi:hypothetical protein